MRGMAQALKMEVASIDKAHKNAVFDLKPAERSYRKQIADLKKENYSLKRKNESSSQSHPKKTECHIGK